MSVLRSRKPWFFLAVAALALPGASASAVQRPQAHPPAVQPGADGKEHLLMELNLVRKGS
jgi:hypothetical protein